METIKITPKEIIEFDQLDILFDETDEYLAGYDECENEKLVEVANEYGGANYLIYYPEEGLIIFPDSDSGLAHYKYSVPQEEVEDFVNKFINILTK